MDKPKSQKPRLFTSSEDRQILNYLEKHYNDYSLKGVSIYKNMMAENILPGRAFYTVRFRVTQNNQGFLNSLPYHNVSEGLKAAIIAANKPQEQNLGEKKSEKSDDKETKAPYRYTDEEDEIILNFLEKHYQTLSLKCHKIYINMVEENLIPGRSQKSLFLHVINTANTLIMRHDVSEGLKSALIDAFNNFRLPKKNEESESSDSKTDFEPPKPLSLAEKGVVFDKTNGASTRWKYSDRDDEIIINYLEKNYQQYSLQDSEIYRRMVSENLIPGRSHKSLSLHIINTAYTLIMRHDISEGLRSALLDAFNKFRIKKRSEENGSSAHNNPTMSPSLFGTASQDNKNSHEFTTDSPNNINPGQFTPVLPNNLNPCQLTPVSLNNMNPDQFTPASPNNLNPDQLTISPSNILNPGQFTPVVLNKKRISLHNGTQTRYKYSDKDDQILIRYLEKNYEQFPLQGQQIYRNMVYEDLIPGRSYKSLSMHIINTANTLIMRHKVSDGLKTALIDAYNNLRLKKVSDQSENDESNSIDKAGHNRFKYSDKDDEILVDYLEKNYKSYPLQGYEIYKNMVADNLIPGRTHKSLSSHIANTANTLIMRHKVSDGLKAVLINLNNSLRQKKNISEVENKANHNSILYHDSKKKNLISDNKLKGNHVEPECTDAEDELILSYLEENYHEFSPSSLKLYENMFNANLIPGKSPCSLMLHVIDRAPVLVLNPKMSDGLKSALHTAHDQLKSKKGDLLLPALFKSISPQKFEQSGIASLIRTNYNKFSADEDELIIKFLEANHKDLGIKGELMYKKMAQENVIPGRSWSSLYGRANRKLNDWIKSHTLSESLQSRILGLGKPYNEFYSKNESMNSQNDPISAIPQNVTKSAAKSFESLLIEEPQAKRPAKNTPLEPGHDHHCLLSVPNLPPNNPDLDSDSSDNSDSNVLKILESADEDAFLTDTVTDSETHCGNNNANNNI